MSSSGALYTSVWEFHRGYGPPWELNFSTDSAGAIINSTLDGAPINGTLDPSQNLSFNDAHFPGEVLLVSFYTGMVLPFDSWEIDRTFMAGTFQETQVIVTGGIGGEQPPVNAPLTGTATAPSATAMAAIVDPLAPAAASGPPSVQATTYRGPWYAILKFYNT